MAARLRILDRECQPCFAPAFWKERDPILRQRLFGLTGREGNHSEDVKECYYFLDVTATHYFMKSLYKHPQTELRSPHEWGEHRRRREFEPPVTGERLLTISLVVVRTGV